jgi:hypothetical protein
MLDFFGLSQGHGSTSEAEHWLVELVSLLGHPNGMLACTHFARTPYPHVAVSLAVRSGAGASLPPVAPEFKDAAAQAMAEHVSRHAGRAVVYPGVDALVGTLTVAELLESSAIERIVVLGGDGADPAPDTLVDTRDFVRPEWRSGRLTLVTTPAPGGRLAPFEIPNPPRCCADH